MVLLKDSDSQTLPWSWKLFLVEIQWRPQISQLCKSGSDVRASAMSEKYVCGQLCEKYVKQGLMRTLTVSGGCEKLYVVTILRCTRCSMQRVRVPMRETEWDEVAAARTRMEAVDLERLSATSSVRSPELRWICSTGRPGTRY